MQRDLLQEIQERLQRSFPGEGMSDEEDFT